MYKSETIGALSKALSIAQGKIENASKNAANPHFKSKYADLAEVLNTIRPVFSECGLSYIQFPSYCDGIAHVDTLLMHESGEWISNTSSAPVTKQDAQGVGSTTTYLRRYSLAAMAGIAQEDDDANSAVGGKGKPQEIKLIGDVEFKELNALLDETEADKEKFCKAYGIASVNLLPLNKYAEATKALLEKKRRAAVLNEADAHSKHDNN